MSHTASLRKSREDKAVKFLEFIKLHSKNPDQLCCFFEGQDAKYYCIRITTILTKQMWSPINCRGKEQVLALHNLIYNHSDYSKARVAFFVDRDFDEPLSPTLRERIYETPCYSIENFYTSLDCFRQVIASEFGITDGVHDGSVLQKCCDLFQNSQKLFHDAMTELNSWAWIQRQNTEVNRGTLNLNDVKLKDLVTVDLGEVTKIYTVPKLKDLFPKAPLVDEVLLAAKVVEFQNLDRRQLYRGKYEIAFLRLFLIKLMEDFRSDCPKFFPISGTIKCSLSKDNLISELSQYADTPDCLRIYLSSLN